MTSDQRLSALIDACATTIMRFRRPLLWLFVLLTALFALSASRVRLDPGFAKMIPQQHPYMRTFTEYARVFSGANRILVDLRWKGEGDIYNREFLEALRKVTDDVFFLPGVERGKVFSLFTPNVRYTEVTEAGFYGDVVVPARFSAQPEELDTVRRNVARSGQIGQLVANDLKGAMVRAELLELDPVSGKKLDYAEVAKRLERIRDKNGNAKIDIHIIGFAQLVGDVSAGIAGVIAFFGIAFLITAGMLYIHTRSAWITALALAIALLPVVWLLGILPLIGFGIDPMSILVPFLIFSIGVSHAMQMTNAWRQAVQAGANAQDAARDAFRRLFVPGTVALLTNALGFLVILVIKIAIVRELAVTACLGVLLMILTNKVFLPVLLSGLQTGHAVRSASTDEPNPAWRRLSWAATPRGAQVVIAVAMALLAAGTFEARRLKIGDVGNGVPELREDGRYNVDNASITGHYNIGVDVLSLVVESKTEGDACLQYPVMSAIESFEIFMRGVAGVRSVVSVPSLAKVTIAAFNEGNPRWQALPRSSEGLAQGASSFNPDDGMNTDGCKAIQVLVFTDNHEGTAIAHVISEIKRYVGGKKTPGIVFRLAGGNVGVLAATNEAVEQAEATMLLAIFGAISLLCLLTFRSWQAILCVIVPLALVSILCNALMVMLGIGLKVSTLPVIALGVGVGVDYGIYLFECIQHQMGQGSDFRHAFLEALRQRGAAALSTALTMAIGVGTWIFSTLKFQADMGMLLAFMFLVNALGAVFLLPALGVGLMRPPEGTWRERAFIQELGRN